jgi:AraC-like DNA-binding protein
MGQRKTDPPRGVLTTALAGARRFRHERYHASPDLDRYVEHYWVVEWDLRGLAPQRAETLPHPSVHLIFEQGGRSRIAGVARRKFSRLLEGRGGVFGVKFRPGGFQPFAGVAVSRFTDAVVRLDEVFGGAGGALDRGVLGEGTDAGRVGVVERFFRARLPAPDAAVGLVTEMVYAVAGDRAILKVDDLARRFDRNPRALQRLFSRYVGVSPKWVIQRYRLHEAAARLASGETVRQATLAHALGYSDQAHFVRDFKATVGVSPAAYARAVRERAGGVPLR